MKRFGLIVLIILKVFAGKAQESECYNSLYKANKSYYEGDMNGVINLITPCLKNGSYNRNEKAQAYRLLALTYSVINELEKADSNTKKLLETDHSYQKFQDPSDEKEFTRLVNSYEILPKLWIGGKAGFNFAFTTQVKNYAVANTRSLYPIQTNYNAGFLAEYYFQKKLSLGINILHSTLSYQHQLDDVAGWKQTFSEDLNYWSIPLYIKYSWIKRRTEPYCQLGMDLSFLKSTNSNIQAVDNTNGTTTITTVETSSRRNKTYAGILTGLGISYKVGGVSLFGESRFILGLNSIVDADRRYDDIGFILEKQYVDDDFKLSNFQVLAGFRFPIMSQVRKTIK